jgi:hypothetical protein
MKMNSIDISLSLGQEILVGKNADKATITKIEFHEKTGEVTLNTTKGTRKALTFRLAPSEDHYEEPADKYR